MSNNCNDIAKILLTEGTNQLQRNDKALDPETLKVHGFGMEEWMQFAENFASHLNYYTTKNSQSPEGDWQSFFPSSDEIKELIAALEESDNLTPHLTLFVCFLKLLELPNERLNNLTKRHLDYYYQEVLQIEKLPATYDKVHLLFELSKNIAVQKFEEGVEFNGGKDGIGKLRIYKLIEEFVGNKATIGSLRNFYMAPTGGPLVKAAAVVNSADGLGEALPEDQSEWYPFGYDTADFGSGNNNGAKQVFTALPDAKMGFAIASDTLKMAEGERHFQISIKYKNQIAGIDDIDSIDTNDFINNVSVYCTTDNKWLRISEESDLVNDLISASDDPENLEEQKIGFFTGVDPNDSKVVKFYSLIDIEVPAITEYNAEVHGGDFPTEKPVFRFIIDTNTTRGLLLYQKLSAEIESITVDVQVAQMRNVTLENDLGTLNPSKPMYPFSNTPIVGSNFVMRTPEIFSKKWQNIDIYVAWKNVPPNLQEYYAGYGFNFNLPYEPATSVGQEEEQAPSADNKSKNFAPKKQEDKNAGTKKKIKALFNRNRGIRLQREYGNNFPPLSEVIDEPDDSAVGNYQSIWARRGILVNNAWINALQGALFTSRVKDNAEQVTYYTQAQYRRCELSTEDTIEKVRLQLFHSFGHAEYPELYAKAMVDYANKVSGTVIPNKPYTPFAEEIQVSYTATDTLVMSTSKKLYSETQTLLFHEHPFGQSEEHKSIKVDLGFVENTSCSLLPKYTTGGELYIGLENALPLQTIPLLFQISEGTENTELTSFGVDDGITWEVLCSNHWKSFDNSEILKNEVDNFLKSGLVSLKLPKEVTSDNTLLPTGYQWIRARMDDKPYDTVCKFLGIHSQVALAQFTNNDNETSHLENGLAAETISKLIERSSAVKSITQPYNSFGGALEENDASYYRRVSERLRHKNRAVTIWDYERLVLQQFPDIYKVKCLSHSNLNSFNAGGSVIVVVIPDTVNKNVFNIYEPRVSAAYLNQIQRYLNKYKSMHVELKVMNPEYEAIRVNTNVQFNEGYDEFLYKSILKDDITKLLAPWAFDETKQIEFGGKLHKSVLIDYIENLEYIDYVESINFYVVDKNGKQGKSLTSYTAASPITIMVSDQSHVVGSATPCKEQSVLTVSDCK